MIGRLGIVMVLCLGACKKEPAKDPPAPQLAVDGSLSGKWPPPGFPIVEGQHELTRSWSISLPAPFARRIEDGSLVLWRPGLTLWIVAFNNDHQESQEARLIAAKDIMSAEATDVLEGTAGGVTRLTYRLVEDGVKSVTAFVIGDAGQLQASIYFDKESDAATALRIAHSITATKTR